MQVGFLLKVFWVNSIQMNSLAASYGHLNPLFLCALFTYSKRKFLSLFYALLKRRGILGETYHAKEDFLTLSQHVKDLPIEVWLSPILNT